MKRRLLLLLIFPALVTACVEPEPSGIAITNVTAIAPRVFFAGTVRSAEFFSLADEMGTVDVGKRADRVLLDANPLESIANTRQIVAVVSKGKLLTQNDLSELVSAAHSAERGVQ